MTAKLRANAADWRISLDSLPEDDPAVSAARVLTALLAALERPDEPPGIESLGKAAQTYLEHRRPRIADPWSPRPSVLEDLRDRMVGLLFRRENRAETRNREPRRSELSDLPPKELADSFVTAVLTLNPSTLRAEIIADQVDLDDWAARPRLIASVTARFCKMRVDRGGSADPERRKAIAERYVINGLIGMGCRRDWAKYLFRYERARIRRKTGRAMN